MAFHSYSLFVEGHTHQHGYQFIPIVGPMVEVRGTQQAPVGRVLAWLDEQREPLLAALAEMHSRSAIGITLTFRLPVSHERGGGEVKMISPEGDPLQNIKREVWKFYPKDMSSSSS